MAGIPHATVHALAALAPLAEGSVVSRVLLKQKSGSVTLFAFDAGEGLSEHTAPFDALVLVTDGTAQVRVGDDEHRVAAGETIVLPANVPHALHAEEAFQMLLVMLRAPAGS
jgi:quercetin dioxygenase-like cupin family protein